MVVSLQQLHEQPQRIFEEGQFELWYQPVYRLDTGAVLHHEVLLRWRDREDNLFLPNEFIPLLARANLLNRLDHLVLNQVVAALAQDESLALSVNLSASALGDPSLIEDLRYLLDSSPVSPDRLSIEITEQAIAENFQGGLDLIRGFRALGCGVVLDNFSGQRLTIAQCRQLPVDRLKLNDQFLHNLRHNPQTQDMTLALLKFSQSMGDVIAKFIGNDETLDIARQAGIQNLQGNFLQRPENQPRQTPYTSSQMSGGGLAPLPEAIRSSALAPLPVTIEKESPQSPPPAAANVWWQLVALVVVGVGLSAGLYFLRHQGRTPLPSLSPAEQRQALKALKMSAKVESAYSFTIAAPDGGIVEKIYHQVGDRITVDLPLIDIRPANLNADQQQRLREQQALSVQQQQAFQEEQQNRQQVQDLEQKLLVAQQELSPLQDRLALLDAELARLQGKADRLPTYQKQDDVARAQAKYDEALGERDRYRQLYNQGGISQEEWANKEQVLKVAQSDLQIAQRGASLWHDLDRVQGEKLELQKQLALQNNRSQVALLTSQLKAAKLQHQQSQARLGLLRSQADKLVVITGDTQTLRASQEQEGIIINQRVQVGSQVYGGNPLLELATIDRLKATIKIDGSLINALKVGQNAKISVGLGDQGHNFSGTITSINPLPDENLANEVTVQFDNPKQLLLLGQPAFISFPDLSDL